MSDTVKLRYSAASNISFHGKYDTGITREDWDEMSWSERDDVITDALYYLVDIDWVDE